LPLGSWNGNKERCDAKDQYNYSDPQQSFHQRLFRSADLRPTTIPREIFGEFD
jgi:hypothetical protein